MALNISSKVRDLLTNNPGQQYTSREIAEWIFRTYPDECKAKQENSRAVITPLDNESAMIQQISAEIGSKRPSLQSKYPQIKTTEGRPRKYYYTESSDSNEIANIEREEGAENNSHGLINGSPKIREDHLYPILSEFLWSELTLYSKRINEKHSKNSQGAGGNKWLYPDVVGLEDLSKDWDREIKDSVQEYKDKKSKLWSFEVKILINRSNVREAFFQAVSNCSWANYGYLVAKDIEGQNAMKELRMLSSLHGIGFIKLQTEDPSESQIMLPAKERADVDWHNANRLLQENDDFKKYIKAIRQFYQTGELRSEDWYKSTTLEEY